MNSYSQLEDFLSNQSFKDWVLKGDSSQQAYWENWQTENPDKVQLLLQARTILLELDSPDQDWTGERQNLLFSKISKRINNKYKGSKSSRYPDYRSYSVVVARRVKASIAVFLLLACMLALLPDFLRDFNEKPIIIKEKDEEWVVKSNPRGQKSIIQLADGSNVVLNAESEIRFRSSFGQGQRNIYLKGEAFFEVDPDSIVPFRVSSGNLVTTALGTSFNITSYTDEKVQVQLATGKVKVIQESKEDEPIYLNPGEEVTVGTNQKLNKGRFDPQKAFLWKKGILLFEKAAFQEAVLDLERWYGVEIEVFHFPKRDLKISGEFKNTSLSDLLESLGYAYSFEYTINNKKVSIHFKPQE